MFGLSTIWKKLQLILWPCKGLKPAKSSVCFCLDVQALLLKGLGGRRRFDCNMMPQSDLGKIIPMTSRILQATWPTASWGILGAAALKIWLPPSPGHNVPLRAPAFHPYNTVVSSCFLSSSEASRTNLLLDLHLVSNTDCFLGHAKVANPIPLMVLIADGPGRMAWQHNSELPWYSYANLTLVWEAWLLFLPSLFFLLTLRPLKIYTSCTFNSC